MKSNKEIIIALEEILCKGKLTKNQKETIQITVERIKSLRDDIDSAWEMMDEMKKSDVKNYKSMLEEKIAEKLLGAMSLMKKKGKDYGTN